VQSDTELLLPTPKAIEYLSERWGIARSPVTWARWSSEHTGPAYRRLGRFRLYAMSDIDYWVRARLDPPIEQSKPQHGSQPAA
jgi:hypothetical protein